MMSVLGVVKVLVDNEGLLDRGRSTPGFSSVTPPRSEAFIINVDANSPYDIRPRRCLSLHRLSSRAPS